MREKNKFSDKRVKQRIFPISNFFITFLAIGGFTTLQMKIIGNYINVMEIPLFSQILIFVLWLVAASVITLWTNYQIRKNYQKPIEEFSKAAHQVATGDFSVYIAPYHTPNKATYLDIIIVDFNKMVEELGSIETLKTDFFSNVSHEFKTPLSVIQNNAELLQKEKVTDSQRVECSVAITGASKRLSNLITNMLKLNKLEKQTIATNPEVYDVCEQLCECALQFENEWEKKGIELIAEIEEHKYIKADIGLMEIVWNNLLSNAIKFTPENGEILLSQTVKDKNIVISVQDTGTGISEEIQSKIFEKFYQGDSSHATAGNGLGLALVKRVLELSNGTISVQSKVGEGSTFVVNIPLYEEGVSNE